MRILHVIQELNVGGAERVLLSLVRSASVRGHEVAVAAAPGPLSSEVSCPVYPLPILGRRPGRIPSGVLALERARRSFRPDLVHCHNPGMAAIASLSVLGARVAGLVTVHGVPDAGYPATARLLRWARLPVVACGPGVSAGLVEQGLSVKATIGNGVSPAPPAVADLAGLRSSWGLPVTGPLAVSVGRLEAQKNHELLIRALALTAGVSLVILGEGTLRPLLERLAGEQGVADRVALPGSHPGARSIVAAADVCILASHWEGLPLAGLEAAAAGTPLVATSVRGVREVFTDRVDCLLVPPDDPASMAAAIRLTLDDPAISAGLVAAGIRLARQHDEAGMVAAYHRLYEDILRPPRRGTATPSVTPGPPASRPARGNGGSSTGGGSSYG